MPVMDGFSLAKTVCDYQNKNGVLNISVIACTAHTQGDITRHCYQAGMVDIL